MTKLYQKISELIICEKFKEAKNVCLVALNNDPNNLDILYLLSTVYFRNHEFEDGIKCLSKVLEANPDFLEANYNLAVALSESKKFDTAIIYFDKVLKKNPNHFWSYYKKANCLQSLNKTEESILSYEKAVILKPGFAEIFYNYGLALHKLRRFEGAIEKYDKAINLKKNFYEAYYNRGVAYKDNNQLTLAIVDFKNAISINPNYALAYANLADTLELLEKIELAISNYENALNLEADLELTLGSYLHCRMQICDWKNLNSQILKCEHNIKLEKLVSPPFPLLSIFDKPSLHFIISKKFVDFKYPENKKLGNILDRKQNKKIRIGYYSADFCEHPLSYLFAEFFELHDKNKFEIFAFSLKKKNNDEMTQRLTKAFDFFFNVEDKSDEEIAIFSREKNIDIAVDLGGHTALNRFGIFSYRAAPIQINFNGYPGTSGASYIDYIIADKTVVPQESKKFFSEKIIYLNNYQPNDSLRPRPEKKFTRSDLKLPEKCFVYCNFNNNFKITPIMFESWMFILNNVSDSVIFLNSNNNLVEKNLKHQAENLGISANRIIFAKRASREDYLARYHNCDLFLDTFPYNAHTTASDALWMGLPVLTLSGQSFASRVGESLLNSVGLPELVSKSFRNFQHKAIELSKQKKLLDKFKLKLNNSRNSCLLFDSSSFCNSVEQAYTKIYQKFSEGLKPDHLEIF